VSSFAAMCRREWPHVLSSDDCLPPNPCSSSDIKQVLNAPESMLSFLGGFEDLVGPLLPSSFKFVNRHHFFVPALRHANLRGFVRAMEQEAALELRSWGAGGRLDLFDTVRVLVMRINLRCLFGDPVLEEGRFRKYYAAFEDIVSAEPGCTSCTPHELFSGIQLSRTSSVQSAGSREEPGQPAGIVPFPQQEGDGLARCACCDQRARGPP
jgi:hypothetical protein